MSDNGKTPSPETTLGIIVDVSWGGHTFPIRFTTPRHLSNLPPELIPTALHTHIVHSDQLQWMGMVSLARDLYSRFPDGSKEFGDLIDRLGFALDVPGRGKVRLADFL